MPTSKEISDFAYFNKSGHLPSKATPDNSKPKIYALHCGDKIVQEGTYALLQYRKKQLEQQGHRFLKIKPIKTTASLWNPLFIF